MTKSSEQWAYKMVIPLSHLPVLMSSCLDRFPSVFQSLSRGSCLPVTIGIDVVFDCTKDSAVPLRRFFKGLRSFRQHHFVRFACETLWVMESDGGDVLYGHDQDKKSWCDLHWLVEIQNHDTVYVTITKPNTNSYKEVVEQISSCLGSHTEQMFENTYWQSMQRTAYHLYRSHPFLQSASSLPVPLHILMIATCDGQGFHTVPLYGMTYGDAKRRHKLLMGQVLYQNHCYPEYFPRATGNGCLFHDLVTLMARENKEDVWDKNGEELYGLGELLFSLYAMNSTAEKTDHDIVMVRAAHGDRQTVDAFRYQLDDLAAL